METILQPWPWYVAGPIIGLFVPIMTLLGKKLGISSSLKHTCAIIFPTEKIPYLKYSIKEFHWSLFFFVGLFGGGLMGQYVLSTDSVAMLPTESFSATGVAMLFVGGLFIGLGTRYAEGCTSGHSISGLSNLQVASLAATASFFAGGLTMRAVNYALGGII